MYNEYGFASFKRRFMALAIDGFLCLLLLILLDIIVPNLSESTSKFIFTIYYLFKDVVGGQSIGKRFTAIQIRSAKNYDKTPNVLQLVLRNVSTLLIPFLEPIVMVAGNRRQKIGDLITGCVVVYTVTENRTVPAPKIRLTPEVKVPGQPVQRIENSAELDVDLSKWDILDEDLQFNKPADQKRHDHIKLGKRRKVDYNRDYIKENDWE